MRFNSSIKFGKKSATIKMSKDAYVQLCSLLIDYSSKEYMELNEEIRMLAMHIDYAIDFIDAKHD
jgi:regulator of sigma D